MVAMLVRCGRCRVELEIAGPGEFACPNCGTRNVVRGGGAGADPFGVPDLGAPNPSQGLGGSLGGLAGVGTPPPPSEPPAGIEWVVCPSCSYRFAVGEVDAVDCPTCGHSITVGDSPPASTTD